MSGSQVLLELVIVLGVAAAITLLFQALRLPVVLGYIVIGVVLILVVLLALLAGDQPVQSPRCPQRPITIRLRLLNPAVPPDLARRYFMVNTFDPAVRSPSCSHV